MPTESQLLQLDQPLNNRHVWPWIAAVPLALADTYGDDELIVTLKWYLAEYRGPGTRNPFRAAEHTMRGH